MSDGPNPYRAGRHLVQVPGPTNVPDRVLRAMASQTIDHRGPEFAALALGLITDVRAVFGTTSPVVMYPGSGTGAWEAALVNTLSPGDRVLLTETGHFANLWAKLATQMGLVCEVIETDWRSAIDADAIAERLAEDADAAIKAVLVTHNETSTGTLSDVGAVRGALDRTGHDALLMVDAVSSLGSVDYRHDDWRVDVTVAASQKGLMLPPGLCFNAVSERALEANASAGLPRAYWDWAPILAANERGFYPYTPATNMLFGLRAALDALFEEGLDAVFERHRRHGEATRAAVSAWGLELQCRDPSAYSPTVTAVVMPDGKGEEAFREVVLEAFGMSLGAGLGRLAGRVFRIGHLGDFDDLSLMAVLSGVELGLDRGAVAHSSGGIAAALEVLRARDAVGSSR